MQDPLGFSLRGISRISRELLPCITSITPRARYFSFIPWAVYDHQRREHAELTTSELDRAVSFREHALALGCIAYHKGGDYPGGSLVGSTKATEWYLAHSDGEVDFRQVRFVENPALRNYLKALLNLGIFVTEDKSVSTEDDEDKSKQAVKVELTALGRELAELYDSHVRTLEAVQQIALPKRQCSVSHLKTWGERGGLCELALPSAADRALLRDMFFCRIRLQGRMELHNRRRDSLLLLLELCRSLTEAHFPFTRQTFADAVYHRELAGKSMSCKIELPGPLEKIARRWQMFYFHYYAATALKSAFLWLVSRLDHAETGGECLDNVISGLDEEHFQREIGDVIGVRLTGCFGSYSPASFFASLACPKGCLRPS